MKKVFKQFLKYYLKYITKYVLSVHRPTVIAIAGSTNKTFVKDEINRQLRETGLDVRSNPRSFNTEIGLPLAILGLPSGFNSWRAWLPIIWRAAKAVFKASFPKYLVLELGVSNRGDMKYLLSIIEPDIAIITDITQRYLEGFADMDELVGEYEYLVKNVTGKGMVILNNDNRRVKEIATSAKAEILRIGMNGEADWTITDAQTIANGQKFTVRHGAESLKFTVKRFGQHHLYAAAAGLAVRTYLKNDVLTQKKNQAGLEP